MGVVTGKNYAIGPIAGFVPGACPHIECGAVAIGGIIVPVIADTAVVCVKAGCFVFPSDAIFDDVPTVACFAAARLESVAIGIGGFRGSVIAVAMSHRPTVFHDYRKFLADKIPAIIAIPPSATTVKTGGVPGTLVMYAKAVCIFTVALTTVRIVIVMSISIQEVMTAAASCTFFVYKETRSLVMVAVNLF